MFDIQLLTFLVSGCALAGATIAVLQARRCASSPLLADVSPGDGHVLGIGTVQAINDPVTVEVESVMGQTFVGKLCPGTDRGLVGALRPGVVLLVAFDPDTREDLTLPNDMTAVRAEFDQMLLHKGLVSRRQLELIRRGVRSHGVVTAMARTGMAREDYREVRLDLMVSRPEGGQFAARETTLVPASALHAVSPGSIVDTYYRRGDESTVAVSVPPAA